MADTIYLKAGDTEPIIYTVSAGGLADLDGVESAKLYARLVGSVTAHVDGVEVEVTDSEARELTFDPADARNGGGNAFDAPGTYRCYTLITWSDGDETRHPGKGYRLVAVDANFE